MGRASATGSTRWADRPPRPITRAQRQRSHPLPLSELGPDSGTPVTDLTSTGRP